MGLSASTLHLIQQLTRGRRCGEVSQMLNIETLQNIGGLELYFLIKQRSGIVQPSQGNYSIGYGTGNWEDATGTDHLVRIPETLVIL